MFQFPILGRKSNNGSHVDRKYKLYFAAFLLNHSVNRVGPTQRLRYLPNNHAFRYNR